MRRIKNIDPCHRRAHGRDGGKGTALLVPKKRYKTKADAMAVVERNPSLSPYRCPNCGHWHLTSKPI